MTSLQRLPSDLMESLQEMTGVDMNPFAGGGSAGFEASSDPQESLGIDHPRGASALAKPAARTTLTKIAELILACDCRSFGEKVEDDGVAREMGRKRLASQLGCRVEDLDEIAGQYGDIWEEWVMEDRVRLGIDSIALRDASWDSLEGAAMRKLLFLVEGNQVRQPMELLAIAKAANTANRGRRGPPPTARTPDVGAPPGGNMNIGIGIGFMPGDPDAGVLPAGNLGTIKLSLTPRIQRQLTAPVELEADRERIIDSVEMLDLKSVQIAGDAESEAD